VLDDLFTPSIYSSAFLVNPWNGDPTQSQRLRAYCKILVNGDDVTNNLDPHLVSLRVIDGPEGRAEIELDDRDGKLPIPPLGSPLHVELGWQAEATIKVFDGVILDLEHGFARESGRRMWVHGSMANWQTAIKQPMQDHVGEGAPPGSEIGLPIPLLQAAQQFAANAGGTASINPIFSAITRDYWAMANESTAHWFQRHAIDLGGQFRIESGNNHVLTVPGQNADGSAKATVQAVWGDNLIGWRVRPITARTVWSGANQQWFSTLIGGWNQSQSGFSLGQPWNANALYQLPVPAANSAQAGQQTEGAGQQGYYGEGRIVMNGEPAASWLGNVLLIGARPGVDGDYYIGQAEHVYSRQGYVTWLDVSPNWTAAGTNNIGSSGWPVNPATQPT
jgi:uncharacterized protein